MWAFNTLSTYNLMNIKIVRNRYGTVGVSSVVYNVLQTTFKLTIYWLFTTHIQVIFNQTVINITEYCKIIVE